MAKETKATDAAKDFADQMGAELSQVEGSGAEGQVTKPDVEAALASGEAIPEAEEEFYLVLAGDATLMSPTTSVVVGERAFYPGENDPRNIVSASEWEEKYKGAVGPPTEEYPKGLPLLKKGGKA